MCFTICNSFLVLMLARVWLGWFPALFYSTVYIGDLHKNSSPIPQTQDAVIALDVESTCLGTRALFYHALVTLTANIIMPSFVVPQHARYTSSPLQPERKAWLDRVRMHLASLWALSHFLFVVCMAATLYVITRPFTSAAIFSQLMDSFFSALFL